MYDEVTYEEERKNTLNLDGLFRILDSFEAFEKKWSAAIDHFHITGGDPLLREDWKEFLAELKRRGKRFSLMGNPETLTDENVTYIAELGVISFQMSLDGLESTHDTFRSKGSFRRTIEKLELLERHGIQTNIMFTLFPTNADELIPLIRYVANNTRASSFCFDVGCFVGNATELEKNFVAEELKTIFSDYIAEKKRLQEEDHPILMREKSRLLKLIRFENREFYPTSSTAMPDISGCAIGWGGVAILSDGTVLPCRRLPLKLGKMPEQSFEEIFLGSEIMKKFRRSEYFEECGQCDFYKVCRGCPAYVYSLTRDPFAKNPLCFRNLVPRKTKEAAKTLPGPSLSTDYKEEFRLVSKHFFANLSRLEQYVMNKTLRHIFIDLAYSPTERREFLADPNRYLETAHACLDDDQKVFLMHYFSQIPDEDNIPKGFGDRLTVTMFDHMLDELFEFRKPLERT
jgi:radical SAM protein with 4Fe4S-binding SPASM domain